VSFSAALLAVGLLLTAAAGPPDGGGAGPKATTPQVSANGRYSVRVVESGPSECHIQVFQEADLTWELPRCIGTVDDLYFVSNDGERVWVLHPLPEIPPPSTRKKIRMQDLIAKVPVAFLVNRAGQVVLSRNVGSFVIAPSRSKIQLMAHHFKWLEGTVGLAGRTPRSNAHNQLEFESVGGHTYRLDF
jgi:hypothetical protein